MKKYIREIVLLVLVLVFCISVFIYFNKNTQQIVNNENNTVIKNPVDQNSNLFKDEKIGFSVLVPKDYKIDENYSYQALGPGKEISGTKFTIPLSMVTGTNLGQDTYLSIENIPNLKTCSAKNFLDQQISIKENILEKNGLKYSVASSSDAGAGNRYDEVVYSVLEKNKCIAVRYFIHYSVFENYPAGSVKEFNESDLINKFDKIRQTLIVN
ncbi:MAG: hypothetical protein WCO35_03255 [Candidatus Nomurabacteria bacterium]